MVYIGDMLGDLRDIFSEKIITLQNAGINILMLIGAEISLEAPRNTAKRNRILIKLPLCALKLLLCDSASVPSVYTVVFKQLFACAKFLIELRISKLFTE